MLTTDNLKLPLYEPTDLADLTDGYNSAMNILDENDSALAENISTTADKITNAYKAADIEIKNEIKDINAIVTDHETLINNNTQEINSFEKMFNLNNIETFGASDLVLSSNTAVSPTVNSDYTSITVTYNSDFSIFKVYGQIHLNSVASAGRAEYEITLNATMPTQNYYIIPAGSGGSRGYTLINYMGDKNKIKLYGYVAANTETTFVFTPSVYFNKTFGDKE